MARRESGGLAVCAGKPARVGAVQVIRTVKRNGTDPAQADHVLIDREKVLAVLVKRFPHAPLCDVAAAANAIVGLEPEFDVLPASGVSVFRCETPTRQFDEQHVARGDVRVLYRRGVVGPPGLEPGTSRL